MEAHVMFEKLFGVAGVRFHLLDFFDQVGDVGLRGPFGGEFGQAGLDDQSGLESSSTLVLLISVIKCIGSVKTSGSDLAM